MAARPKVDDDLLLRLTERLTERDLHVIRLLHEHTTLTTSQVCDIGWHRLRAAARRMSELYRLRVVDRLRPCAMRGTAQFHWILDEAGAARLAAERGITREELRWTHRRTVEYVSSSQRLAHLVGVNGFFTALVRSARCSDGRQRLVEWWPERRCVTQWGELVQPDAFGVWADGSTTVKFLLEWDRGTERPGSRLAAKLSGYERLASASAGASRAPRWWLLFRFPGAVREQNARKALGHSTVLIATAALPEGASPADPVWLPLRAPAGAGRVTLAELGHCRP